MHVGTYCKKYISPFTWIVTHLCLHFVCPGTRFHHMETLNIIFKNVRFWLAGRASGGTLGAEKMGCFFARHTLPLSSGVSISNISKSKTDQFLVPEFPRHSFARFLSVRETRHYIFLFSETSSHFWGPPSFRVKWVPGALSPGLKKLIHIVGRSHPFSAEMSGTVTECRCLSAVVLK